MGKKLLNKIWIFIPIMIFIFLYEMILFDEIPMANDLVAHKPISKWKESVKLSSNIFPQWFPNLFSGMPSYGGYIYTPGDPLKIILDYVFFNRGLKIWFYLIILHIDIINVIILIIYIYLQLCHIIIILYLSLI